MRAPPLRDATYDTIVCASVLEHVGCDNRVYTGAPSHSADAPTDFLRVMCAFDQLLKPGGTLLLTVPFGHYGHHGWLQQFDRELLARAVHAFTHAREVHETFYRYAGLGWTRATADECGTCVYGQGPARAASAVACLRLVKEGAWEADIWR